MINDPVSVKPDRRKVSVRGCFAFSLSQSDLFYQRHRYRFGNDSHELLGEMLFVVAATATICLSVQLGLIQGMGGGGVGDHTAVCISYSTTLHSEQ